MGENMPYTFYLSQKEHIVLSKKSQFLRRFRPKGFEKPLCVQVQGVKNTPFDPG
jgi:hypothetical protein